jgi:hypothetical protein
MEGCPSVESSPKHEVETGSEPGLVWAGKAMERFGDVGDEEAVFMLALTLGHPEWEGELLRQVKAYKPHIVDPEGLLGRIKADFESSGNESGQNESVLESSNGWNEHIPEVEERLAEINAYFNPAEGEYPRRIVLVPSDTILSSANSGSSYHIGDTVVILAHSGNIDNVGHEFLHGIVNPMTEALQERLPEQRIVALASDKYKIDEGYGEHALSLLNEELIRTYNDVVRNGEALPSLEGFKSRLSEITDEDLAGILASDPGTSRRLEQMGIASLDELKSRAEEYFERYMKNELREKIFGLYREYDEQKRVLPDLKFKDFFAERVDQLFSE